MKRSQIDPRLFQIASLLGLLGYGLLALHFEVSLLRVALLLGCAMATEWTIARVLDKRFDPRSPAISALSLALLLRTADPLLAAGAAALAIASKTLIQFQGKHLFNPTCLALVVCLALSDAVWVSAGQWGRAAFFFFGLACLGTLVVQRSARADVPFAFLGWYAALLFGRAAWLGDPWEIPAHSLQSGALLLFAFFMISDPRTTPDSRWGRVLFTGAVAALALWIQFGLYEQNGLLWALALCAPLVPFFDAVLPGPRFAWAGAHGAGRSAVPTPSPIEEILMFVQPKVSARLRWALLPAVGMLALFFAQSADAFCGFYVGKADTKLFNKASQVVLVRDKDRTVVTLSNDYEGDLKEFAMVIPVPTFIRREQIHIGERAVIDHLDAYTAPRLVEYFDPDPCMVYSPQEASMDQAFPAAKMSRRRRSLNRAEGVTIEAAYTVGEYDILILSAEQSDGLARWLKKNGYKLPKGAERILGSYIKQEMRFFVAKVNLEEQAKIGAGYLRPLQVAYDSPKFVLPIRLGTLNARGAQELFVYTLTRSGRVETTNYRTVKLPTGMEIPSYVKTEFGDFYRALFDEQVKRERMNAVFLEYAWDMNWCDPCAADPLSPKELSALGVFWLGAEAARGQARDVFVTRLHVRYDEKHFPADLHFQETGNRENFQGRYVMRHPFEGATCSQANPYYQQVRERKEKEAQTLASLTGWSLVSIREKLDLGRYAPVASKPWWESLWP
jgi:Na+-translocating ferredoxin:NAD+ oxidoreductase RnfD subunit